ncbi:MAG: hypothetical protein AAGK97_05580 [Bacteroidota bacterium]
MPISEVLYYPEQTYHIYNHACGYEDMFCTPYHYDMFLNTYTKFCNEIFHTYAFALMPNHFHLVAKIETFEKIERHYLKRNSAPIVSENDDFYDVKISNYVSSVFGSFLSSYVQKFNRKQKRKGTLLRENSKRKMVYDEAYFKQVIKVVHYNPVKHGFCKDPKEYDFTSYFDYINRDNTMLKVNDGLEAFGGYKHFLSYHQDQNTQVIDLEEDFP